MSEVLIIWALLAAQADGLDAEAAIAEAIALNPTLAAAVLDTRRAAQDQRAEEARYFPALILEAGANHIQSPNLRAQGGTAFPTTDRFLLASELKHAFSFGTAVSLRLEGSRATSQAQFGTGAEQLVSLGPGYGLLGRLTLTQPILRGFGTEIGEAGLRQARLRKTAADRARDDSASQILRDVLVGYWELWYAEQALLIDQEAFALAARQRDEARARISAGSMAEVEAYAFETRVAELEQATVVSGSAWQQQSLTLSALLGRESPALALHAKDQSAPAVTPPSGPEIREAVERQSFELERLRANVAVALDQASVAGDANRTRLDLTASLTAQGLGNQEVPPAFEQLGGLDAVSAQAGLTLELPLSGDRRDAERQSASLAAERARAQLVASTRQLIASASAEQVRVDQALRRIELSNRTVAIAEMNVAAQKERYDKGDAILLQVYEAQDSLRRAQLGAKRSQVDALQASLRLEHLMGGLLTRLGRSD